MLDMFAVLKVILNALFFNFDVDKAVSDPRIHNQLSPNTTQVEPEFDKVSVKNTKKCWFMQLILESCAAQRDNTIFKSWITQNAVTSATSNPLHLSGINVKSFCLISDWEKTALLWG